MPRTPRRWTLAAPVPPSCADGAPRRAPAGVRLALLLALVPALAATAGCGREAPSWLPGSLAVDSSPAGAGIWLDGAFSGAVTPDTLRDLGAGDHVVKAALAAHRAEPESLQVTVPAGGMASAAFTLTPLAPPPPQVVLLEGFSNVSCTGCPAMAATLRALMGSPGYGPDRLLLIDYAGNWPSATDPHWLANQTDNRARLQFYQSLITVGLPTLFLDGALAGASGSPPLLADLRALVDARLARDPGFTIAVAATLDAASPTTVAAVATLTAVRAVDCAGAVLHFALVENPVVYATPPGSEGETEFRWIMRDFATAATSPLPLAAGDPAVVPQALARQTSWVAAHLGVVAFVQHPATRAVLQAGYAPVQQASRSPFPGHAAAPRVPPAPPIRTPG